MIEVMTYVVRGLYLNSRFALQQLYSNRINGKYPSHNTIRNMSSTEPISTGDAVGNDDQSRTGQSERPVQRDEAALESTEYDNGGDSDEQLGTFYRCLLLFGINQT